MTVIENSINTKVSGRRRSLMALAVLVCLILPIYSNTFDVPWHYDDQPNILANERLHLTSLDTSSIRETFFAQPGRQRLFRPLPNLSFAINWFFGGDDPAGYHTVNMTVHILTAFFLYLTVYQIFNTPLLLSQFSRDDVFSVSLFSAVLWAINPIQTQAVTYIVQRMAQMAALFYVAGMYFYLKARLRSSRFAMVYRALVALMFLCAVFSKENAIMFPVALLLMETLLFDSPKGAKSRQRILLWGGIILIVGIAGIFVFVPFNPLVFLESYHFRSFSFQERILSEPRIVLFYLSQIFFPLPSRLSLAHDFSLSRSLFDPPITFLAVFSILGLIAAAILFRRRRPLFSFATLFFFVNHIVESSIFPLELMFEHRNYLPSLFLFMPVAVGVRCLMNRCRHDRRIDYPAIAVCIPAVIVALGMFTYERNAVWGSTVVLWYDAMKKAPKQAGPVNNIATYIGWGKDASPREKEVAIGLFNRAATMDHPTPNFRARIYDNIGVLSAELGKSGQAEEAYRTAIGLDPQFLKARHNLARLLAATAQWEKALTAADELIVASRGKALPDYYETRGLIRLWMDEPENALADLNQSLNMSPFRSPVTLLYAGCALSRTGRYEMAERFYKLSQNRQPPQILVCFFLIENSARAGDQAAAEQFARVLFSEKNVYDILKTFKKLPEPGRTAPLDKALVAPIIKTVYQAIGREAEEKAILPR
ncbi:MAG: hypothetical protein AB1724_16185 [Thermodesulfobacteriota bacterium]